MQPVLVIESPVSGLVYVNGRLIGEVSENGGVSLPVAPWGAVYVEHRPLTTGYLPIARRITLSAGRPVVEALEAQSGVAAVCWPGGVIDLELTPERVDAAPERAQQAQVEDFFLRLLAGANPRVEVYRADLYGEQVLPSGAQPPEAQAIGGFLYLTGSTACGQYVRIFSPELVPALSVDAREIELSPDGAVRALIDLNDSVGHARLMTWTQSGEGMQVSSIETLWGSGVPNWPESPQDTALAAAEAILEEMAQEAEGYFAPSALGELYAAQEAIRSSGGVTKMKYPLLDGRQAVGLLRLESRSCASVSPLYYHALPMGGSQGTWRLDRFNVAE